MYEAHYNLTGDPFGLRPNLQNFYVHESYKKAQSYLLYALRRGEGLLLVTGEPGTGKTSLVRDCVRKYTEQKVHFIELSLGNLDAEDIIYLTAHKLGISSNGIKSIELYTKLEAKLQSLFDSDTRVVIVMDEAQSITNNALDQIKNLSNLEYKNAPLLQFFLVGQKSLIERLQLPEMSQIFQRVTAACQLHPLDRSELREYVTHCLAECGWSGEEYLDETVISELYEHSGGIPRKVNLIASRLLLRGMVNDLDSVGTADMQAVLKNLQSEGLLT